jgi:hypothetical protein
MRKDGAEAHQEVTEEVNSNGGISFLTRFVTFGNQPEINR